MALRLLPSPLPLCALAAMVAGCTTSTFGSGDLGGSTLTAQPPNLPVGSTATAQVRLVARTAAGRAVVGSGQPVTFAVPGCQLDRATAPLGPDGAASVTVSSCSAGPHPVSAALAAAGESFPTAASSNINGFAAAADAASILPGSSLNFQIEAPYGYLGTATFRSSDPTAVLPPDVSLGPDDHGVAALIGAVVLNTPGSQTVEAVDRATGAVLSHAVLQVAQDPGSASDLAVTVAPSGAGDVVGAAGASLDVTVTALDPNGGRRLDFVGTLTLTASDPSATLPDPATLAAADAGRHVFRGVVLRTAGSQTLSVDVPGGAHRAIAVQVLAGPQAGYLVSHAGGSSVVAGSAVAVSVAAVDASNNQVPVTAGSVVFSTSDPAAAAPPAIAIRANGSGGPVGVTLKTAGSQSFAVADAQGLTSNLDAVAVAPAAASALALQMASAALVGEAIATASLVAVDPFGNAVPRFTGSATLGSTDPGALLPATVAIAAGAQGRARLDGLITLNQAGAVHVTATDAAGYLTAADKTVYVATSPPSAAHSTWGAPAGSHTVADGTATVTLTLALADSAGDPSIGVDVTFASSTYGDVIAPTHVETDLSGMASVTLASTVAELKSVTATAGNLSLTAPVSFVAGVPVKAQSSLSVTPAALTADGATQATLTLVLRDVHQNLAAGVPATLTASGSRNTLTPGAPATDATGQLVTTLASTAAEAKIVTASLADGALTAPVTFTAGPAGATRSELLVSSGARLADGASPTRVTLRLRDVNGNAVTGRGAALGIDGVHATWSPAPSGVTDATGAFVTTLTSTDVGRQMLTAQAGSLVLTASLDLLAAGCRAVPRLPGPPWPALGATADVAAVGDVDGDGLLDVAWVSTAAGSGTLSLVRGRGDGTFQARQDRGRPAGPAGIAIADIDADGRAEVLVSRAAGGVLEIWAGGSGGVAPAPTTRATGQTGSSRQPLATGDIDGDGDVDVVLLAPDSASLVALAGDGAGNFTASTTPLGLATPRALVLADTSGDSRADALVVGTDGGSTGQLAVSLGQIDGTLAAPTQVATGSTTPAGLAAADLDGDGKLDVAVAHLATPTGGLFVLRGAGGGAFGTAGQVLAGAFASVVLARLDTDPYVDAAVHATDGTALQVLRNDGTGALSVASTTYARLDQAVLCAGDLDGDGRPDLIAPSPGAGRLGIWLGSASGTPQAPRPQSGGDTDARAAVLSDFDNDGLVDVVAAGGGSGTLAFLGGVGDGTFAAPVTRATVAGAAGLASADLDGDGRLDLVAATGTQNQLAVLLGQSGGAFAAPTTVAAPGGPVAVALADLDQDGHVDAVAGRPGGADASLFLGVGDGTLAAATTVVIGATVDFPVLPDLDGDGRPDLALLDVAGARAWVVLATGGGTFGAPAAYATGAGPTGLVAADLDGDDRRDLVVSHGGDNTVGVLLGRGDGTLRPLVAYAAVTAPSAPRVADINNDGFADVVVASATEASLAVLLGNGDGTLAAPLLYPTQMAGSAAGLGAADLTAQGHLDVLALGAGANGINVALSRGCP